MTNEDKLRFEVGEGFNKLSEEQIEKLCDIIGVSGRHKNYWNVYIAVFVSLDPESLVQFLGETDSTSDFLFPILGFIEDPELRNYAFEYISKRKPGRLRLGSLTIDITLFEVFDAMTNILAENWSDLLLYYFYNEIKNILNITKETL